MFHHDNAAHAMRHPGIPSRHAREDDDEADDDRPASKKGSSSGADVGAAAGMSVGMIVLVAGGLLSCCICLPILGIALLLPAVQKVREAAARTQAMNNMKQIAFACHAFHDTNKHLPPPQMKAPGFNVPPADLSWRVSILPFVEQNNLFNRFDKTQNWDHPNNANLANPMPQVFQIPSDPPSSQTKLQYFTGPGTLFPTPQTIQTMAGITDGTSNTFLFAEARTGLPWSKNVDMVVQPAGALPVKDGAFLAAMCDGTVRFVQRNRTSDDILRSVINPRDGQQLPMGWGE